MAEELIITEMSGGGYRMLLPPCRTSVLAIVLDRHVPHVWVTGHRPHVHGWWTTCVPLDRSGEAVPLRVRGLTYDFVVSTGDFLDLLPRLGDVGITLHQMTKPVPPGLSLALLPERAAFRILVDNGLHVAFYLPHAMEIACVESPRRDVLKRVAAAYQSL